jgi:hypothetical protein
MSYREFVLPAFLILGFGWFAFRLRKAIGNAIQSGVADFRFLYRVNSLIQKDERPIMFWMTVGWSSFVCLIFLLLTINLIVQCVIAISDK